MNITLEGKIEGLSSFFLADQEVFPNICPLPILLIKDQSRSAVPFSVH
jgi:hypothetical protein